MKRFLSATLGVLILAVCAGCGASHSGSSAAADNSASASVPAVQSAVQSAETAEADSSSAVANLNPAPEATVIESQDCFDTPYLFSPGD